MRRPARRGAGRFHFKYYGLLFGSLVFLVGTGMLLVHSLVLIGAAGRGLHILMTMAGSLAIHPARGWSGGDHIFEILHILLGGEYLLHLFKIGLYLGLAGIHTGFAELGAGLFFGLAGFHACLGLIGAQLVDLGLLVGRELDAVEEHGGAETVGLGTVEAGSLFFIAVVAVAFLAAVGGGILSHNAYSGGSDEGESEGGKFLFHNNFCF